MVSTQQVQELLERGGTVVGEDGSKIGSVGQVFLDDQTGEPEWVTVKTGLFGGGESFVPLTSASVNGDEVRVPFTKDVVKDAPRVDDSEGHLSEAEEAELFRYYGQETQNFSGPAGTGDRQVGHTSGQGISSQESAGPTTGHDTSGPETDNAMTRSEEQLNVGTERVAAGKARLRKYVVTENVTTTVPVSREEVRVEREPITDANRGEALSGGDITSEEHEVELTQERVVVDKEVVPVERVRMDVETVTEDQQVSEEVRKEQIEADGDESAGPRGSAS
jgi:uncharacterized protein (TIGR02271 family)